MGAELTYWEPEDRGFWSREGARVARRNLAASVPPLILSFAVWMLWSAVVVYLPHLGFRFTTNQLFWLAAAPGLAGGTLRLFFSFMVPIFGGRRWTVISTLLLLVPTLGIGFAVQDPTTGFPTFLMLALAAGIGGGNFASSMSNISLFYPGASRGAALGVNAGLGNLGVGLAQLSVPLVIGAGLFGVLAGGPQTARFGEGSIAVWMQNAGFVWVLPIVIAAVVAWYAMDDLPGLRGGVADQAGVFVRRHTWVLSWLYLGTFGSFVGFSAAFPLVAETLYGLKHTPWLVMIGPLLGALARPLGGWLADRVGGARIALASFVALTLGVVILSLAGTLSGGASYPVFITVSGALFIASGIGNGAVFQLIPAVFVAERRASLAREPGGAGGQARALREGTLEGSAALGLASGVAAFGGFFIPKAYGTALSATGSPSSALYVFTVFYLSCIVVTWWFYLGTEIDQGQVGLSAAAYDRR